MKTKYLVLIILIVSNPLQAQDAEQILYKYYESIGGLDKWRELKTMKITAMVDMVDMKINETTYLKAPNLRRYESDSEEGGKFIQAFDVYGKIF